MRFLKGMFLIGLFTVFLTGCISIPIGDEKLKLSSDGITVTDEEGVEHSYSFDEENDQLTISSNDGEIAFGTEVSIPESFPSDIPITDDAVVFSATNVENAISISYATDMELEKLNEMYANYFNSSIFEETSESMFTDGNYSLIDYQGERKDGRLHVSIQGSDSADDARMVIMLYEGKNDDE